MRSENFVSIVAMSSKQVIFVLGGPGCGKGTQATRIAQKYGIGYAAAGDILREVAKKTDTEIGRKVAEIINAGQLVPPELICQTIKNVIESSDKEYFLMDGFPRSIEQAEAFEKVFPPCTAVALLDAPDEVLIARCSERGKISGRADDRAECIPNRITVYKKQTQPVLEKYTKEGKVFIVNSNQPIDDVTEEFVQKLRKYWKI